MFPGGFRHRFQRISRNNPHTTQSPISQDYVPNVHLTPDKNTRNPKDSSPIGSGNFSK
ncbi:hypothetical protein Tco_0665147, partial [Tanacetum coccineum]